MKQWMWPILVFFLICGLSVAARWLIGTIYSSWEAIELLRALQQSGLFVGSTVATAAATTLALMLALIGMINRVEAEFSHAVYCNIGRIAKLATASLMSSLVLLLFLAFPVGEFDGMPHGWYSSFYEAMFAATTVTVALLAATVTVLYRTVREVISKVTPEET